jgi:predicted  nucleic acid-binding Zn-ribbon protein
MLSKIQNQQNRLEAIEEQISRLNEEKENLSNNLEKSKIFLAKIKDELTTEESTVLSTLEKELK